MIPKLRTDGFSLLEIIVALAMVSTILISAFHSTIWMKHSIYENEEHVRALITAQSMAEWWIRLLPGERMERKSDQFIAIPADSGLLYASNYEWCVRMEAGAIFLIIRDQRAERVRIPLPRME